jgi:hypothetical protein
MSHKINPTPKIVIVLDDVEHVCEQPNVGAVADMEDELAEAKANGKGGTRPLMNLVVACGLPLDVVRKLSGAQLEEIMKVLTPTKNG